MELTEARVKIKRFHENNFYLRFTTSHLIGYSSRMVQLTIHLQQLCNMMNNLFKKLNSTELETLEYLSFFLEEKKSNELVKSKIHQLFLVY